MGYDDPSNWRYCTMWRYMVQLDSGEVFKLKWTNVRTKVAGAGDTGGPGKEKNGK